MQRKNKKEPNYMEREFSAGSIRIYEGNKNDYGTIKIDSGFAIRIKIIEGKNGLFISYPAFKNKKGEYSNQAFCFDKEVIRELNEIIEEMYDA